MAVAGHRSQSRIGVTRLDAANMASTPPTTAEPAAATSDVHRLAGGCCCRETVRCEATPVRAATTPGRIAAPHLRQNDAWLGTCLRQRGQGRKSISRSPVRPLTILATVTETGEGNYVRVPRAFAEAAGYSLKPRGRSALAQKSSSLASRAPPVAGVASRNRTKSSSCAAVPRSRANLRQNCSAGIAGRPTICSMYGSRCSTPSYDWYTSSVHTSLSDEEKSNSKSYGLPTCEKALASAAAFCAPLARGRRTAT